MHESVAWYLTLTVRKDIFRTKPKYILSRQVHGIKSLTMLISVSFSSEFLYLKPKPIQPSAAHDPLSLQN